MSKKVLVLCTGNSCRSQIAEGLINAQLDGFEAFSAGTKPSGYVHPNAIAAMRELGIDLSQNESKNLEQFKGQRFDYVITVCDSVKEDCPVWLGDADKRIHIGFDDPAEASGTEEEIMAEFRRARDEIAERVLGFLQNHNESELIIRETQ
jgi:arsenate reductase